MRIPVMRSTCVAVLFVGLTCLGRGQQTDGSALPGTTVKHRNVLRFQDFVQQVHFAASQTGIAPDTADHILQEFARRNKVRLVPYTEWRAFLLESLYASNVPYRAALKLLSTVRSSANLPVDTGFLEAVRTVDLGDRTVYQIDTQAGLVPPRPIEQPLPAFPEPARAAGVEGIVHLECIVLEDGTVANCSVKCPAGWGIDESAVLAIQDKWRFEPGLLNGRPVPVRTKIEVSMRLY